MHAHAWAAWAQWVIAAVAAVAAVIALRQLVELRKTREKVAQPNVVFTDLNHQNWHYLDLVIKNFGETPAYSIKLKLPPLDVVPWTTAQQGSLWHPIREVPRVVRGLVRTKL